MGQIDNRMSDRDVRRYRVTYFGESLGAFMLPVGEHLEGAEALPRPVLTKPYKAGDGADAIYFWTEPDPEGDFITVYWRPRTAWQVGEAERFYLAARGLKPDGSIDHEKQPPMAARTAEEMRLIRAVLANPEEDQPYLEYADWLTRRGDPYGEYIHLSLRMLPLAEDDEFRERLQVRRDALVEKHGPKWIRPLTELALFPGFDEDVYDQDPESYDPEWWFGERGVIEQVAVGGGTFVFRTNPARLFAAAPFLRTLILEDPAVTVADLATIPQMAQIEMLYLNSGSATEEQFQRFADSPHFGGLRSLTTYGYGIGPPVARILAGARWMPTLGGLSFDGNHIEDRGAEALAASPNCANLDSLELDGNGLTDRGLIAVCESPHLAKLHTLEFARNEFTAQGMRALRSATFAPKLHYLDLPQCGLDAAALAELAAGEFPALRVIDVSGHLVGDDGIAPLIAAPFFRALEGFWADACDLGAGTVQTLVNAGVIALEDLSLRGNRIDADAVAMLVRSRLASRLKMLYLARNPLGTDGVLQLASAELPALQHLDLAGIRLGKAEVLALVKAAWRKQIIHLNVSDDCIGERGAELLTERFGSGVVAYDEYDAVG